MSEHQSSVGPVQGGKRPAGSLCPKCLEKHEHCAAERKCEGWETSDYVCRVFNVRPYRRPRSEP